MKNLFLKIKENKQLLNELSSKELGKANCIKSFVGSIILSIVALIPFALIYIELLKIYSPVLFVYHVTLVFVCLTVYLFVPFTNMLYYAILKNYTQKDEIQNLSLRYVFLGELLNPIYLIIAIIFVLVLRYFIG